MHALATHVKHEHGGLAFRNRQLSVRIMSLVIKIQCNVVEHVNAAGAVLERCDLRPDRDSGYLQTLTSIYPLPVIISSKQCDW